MKVAVFIILLSYCVMLACSQQCKQQTVCDESVLMTIKGSKGDRGDSSGCACDMEALKTEMRREIGNIERKIPIASCVASSQPGRRFLFSGMEVFCDKGWTVFQRRINSSIDFNLSWREYKRGFGTLDGEFWLGLDTIYKLTRSRECRLWIDLKAFDDDTAYAKYSHFSVDGKKDLYRLHVGGYSGTAGDSLFDIGLRTHNNMPFSTKDRDHDNHDGNCAERFGSGWWFNSCFNSNLNAPWGESTRIYRNIIWESWKGWEEALKESTMKFRCD